MKREPLSIIADLWSFSQPQCKSERPHVYDIFLQSKALLTFIMLYSSDAPHKIAHRSNRTEHLHIQTALPKGKE